MLTKENVFNMIGFFESIEWHIKKGLVEYNDNNEIIKIYINRGWFINIFIKGIESLKYSLELEYESNGKTVIDKYVYGIKI